ncbi:MAG: hypothetical protein IPK85_11860 [Gemmatimonadetes bacterium]|nr:hypothetical protein [Gemmatimonadota bacterium]
MSQPGRAWGTRGVVWLVALMAAVLHMVPYWHAQSSARDGYEFSGNLTISPDYMQYRVWERQAVREGPIVSNTFTTESNRPHLPVFYYWAIGRTAVALGVRPEAVYAYSGAMFAVALALLVWAFVARSMAPGAMRWWAYGAIMFGGGLGGHIKVLEATPGLSQVGVLRRLLIEPAAAWPVFEEYRGHYVFRALYDSHFLLLWVVALLAILAMARAIESYEPRRVILAALGCAAMTLLHVYEGVTLWAIAAAAVLAAWQHPVERRAAWRVLGWCTVSVAVVYAALGTMYARSGLPLPGWHAVNILFSVVVLAFPISWALMAIGLRDYWHTSGPRERFLVAWAGACTALTLSGPFYPYPDRGTLTMSVPVLLIGAMIFAVRYGRPGWRSAIIAIGIFAAGPVWQGARSWVFSGFRPDAPFIYLSPGHRAVRDSLIAHSDTSHVLLAEPAELLWLAPTFPGRLHVGHFFLTVGYKAKHEQLQRALAFPTDSLPRLLAASGSDWLFVGTTRDRAAIERAVPLRRVVSVPEGTLYAVERGAVGATP